MPEVKTVKHRLHLDVYAPEVADVLGGDEVSWHDTADPEGSEFCVLGW